MFFRPRNQSGDGNPRRTNYIIFPLPRGYAASFVLSGIPYELHKEQVKVLVDTGVLRAANVYTPFACHKCRTQLGSSEKPWVCPICYAEQWDEFVLLYCSSCHALFELNWEERTSNPYDHYPKCPRCGREQWCPEENSRLDAQAKAKLDSPEDAEEQKKRKAEVRKAEEQAFRALMERRKSVPPPSTNPGSMWLGKKKPPDR